jgi:ribose 5-phosphate isomerase B
MTIAMGSDHAGFSIKTVVKNHLTSLGMDVRDHGTDSEEAVDYADYGVPAARDVASGEADRGILVCGSGQGMVMVANKVSGIRAALAWSEEIARLSRQHNDANVLCLPGRFVDAELAVRIVDTWLAEGFEGGRHVARVDKIMKAEGE